jgi:hypothetical protein
MSLLEAIYNLEQKFIFGDDLTSMFVEVLSFYKKNICLLVFQEESTPSSLPPLLDISLRNVSSSLNFQWQNQNMKQVTHTMSKNEELAYILKEARIFYGV